MDQKIINLYDDFTHSRISRREFNDKLTKLAGSAAAAARVYAIVWPPGSGSLARPELG